MATYNGIELTEEFYDFFAPYSYRSPKFGGKWKIALSSGDE
jgi:hypothetical protein